VLDAHSGGVVRTIHVGESPDALAVDPGTDRVVVAIRDDASVSVLDAGRGVVLRTVTVGAQPLAVAVDEQTSRAFVVRYGGTVDRPAAWWVSWAEVVRRWLPPQVLPMLPRLAQQMNTYTVPASVSVIDAAAVYDRQRWCPRAARPAPRRRSLVHDSRRSRRPAAPGRAASGSGRR